MLARIQRAIVLLLICLASVGCEPELSMTANTKNAYKGRYKIADHEWQMKGEEDQDTSREFDVPLPETLPTEDIWVVTALNDFKMDKVLTKGLNLNIIHLRSSATHLTFLVRTQNANHIQFFHISYLIIRKKAFLLHNLDAFHIAVEVGQNVSIDQPFQARLSIPKTVNQTGDLHAFYVISRLDLAATNQLGIIDISSTINIFGSSLGLVIISKESVPTFINQIAYSIIIYNKDYLYHSSYLNVETGYQQANFGERDLVQLSLFSREIEMLEFNTFLGLTSFRLQGQDQFYLSSFVRQPYANKKGQFGFEWIVKAESKVKYLNVSYLVIFSQYCDYLYPLYYREHFSCYSSCPEQTIQDPSLLECLSHNESEEDNQAELKQQKSNKQNNLIWVLSSILLVLIILAILFLKQRKHNKEDYMNFQLNKKPYNQQQLTESNINSRYEPTFHNQNKNIA